MLCCTLHAVLHAVLRSACCVACNMLCCTLHAARRVLRCALLLRRRTFSACSRWRSTVALAASGVAPARPPPLAPARPPPLAPAGFAAAAFAFFVCAATGAPAALCKNRRHAALTRYAPCGVSCIAPAGRATCGIATRADRRRAACKNTPTVPVERPSRAAGKNATQRPPSGIADVSSQVRAWRSNELYRTTVLSGGCEMAAAGCARGLSEPRCASLHRAVLCCNMLHGAVLCCSMLHHVATCCIVCRSARFPRRPALRRRQGSRRLASPKHARRMMQGMAWRGAIHHAPRRET